MTQTVDRIADTSVRPAGLPEPLWGADNGNLDILRSLAVLLVVAFHVEMFAIGKTHVLQRPLDLWQLGHWGVLLFFVHTSFVLMLSLKRQLERTPSGMGLFRPFIIRRAFRLLPLSVLTVLIVMLFRLPVAEYPPQAMARRAPDVLANLFLVQNLTHHESAVATLWSLPYEMQMYLVLPILFAMTTRWRTLVPAIAFWLCAVVLSKVLLSQIGAWYDMPLYIPCFLSGVVAYYGVKSIRPRFASWMWPPALVIVSLAYLGHASITAGWFLCLLVGLMIPLFSPWPEGRIRTVVRLIARYSYGVYLSHFICLWLAFYAMPAPRLVQGSAFLVLTVSTSVMSYHLVEMPMIKVGSRFAPASQRSSTHLTV